jgi:drug/metabolite transporter (DMT)-like permease
MTRTKAIERIAPPLFVVIWATGFIVARLVAPYADPLTFLLVRYGLAILVLASVSLAVKAPWPRTARDWRNAIVAGIILHGIYLGGVFWSIKHGLPAGIAALVAGLQPLATGLLVGPFLGEQVSARRWAGIAAGFIGAALVISPKIGTSDGFPASALVICFLGMIAITFGTIWQKRTAQAADLRTNTAVQYVGAAIVTLPFALMTEELRLDFEPALWAGLIWAVFGLSIGAIGLLLILIRRGAVAGVAALLFLVPPVAALMAFLFFGESLSPIQIVGMGAAAVGVALANRG